MQFIEKIGRAAVTATRRLRVSAAVAALAAIGCNGGKHLAAPTFSERDYSEIAQAQPPEAAYLQWKAHAESRPADEVARQDESFASSQNPFDAEDPAAVAAGQVVYGAHCASCHGEHADGRGPVMNDQYLKAMDFHAGGKSHTIFFGGGRTPKKWFNRVHDGVISKTPRPDGSPNQMPPFRDTLTNEEVWLSLTYLHAVVTGEKSAKQ